MIANMHAKAIHSELAYVSDHHCQNSEYAELV